LPDAWAFEDEALGEGDDCIGLALGDGDDWLGDCVVDGDDDDWEGDCEGACAKAEPANSAAAAVVIMNLLNIAGLRDDFQNPKGKDAPHAEGSFPVLEQLAGLEPVPRLFL
jgi:hypothetical protein